MKREATRDIVKVNFKTKPFHNRLVLIGNHWPSRGGGQYESEPYRIIAGETLSYFHQRILEENNKEEKACLSSYLSSIILEISLAIKPSFTSTRPRL